MNVRVEEIAPIDVTGALTEGQILEYDSTNHYYTALASGTAVAILLGRRLGARPSNGSCRIRR